jgi:hypothetical protein
MAALTDDDLDAILDGIDNGEYDNDDTSDEIEDEIADDQEEEATDNEDTDQDDESEDEDETDTQDDDSEEETSEETDEDEEEDAPVDTETKETEDKDSDTKQTIDGEAADTVKIDQAEYDRYKKFYDEVANAEFTANGKKVKGFQDPQKIIQAQQMAYGYSDKMAGFKQYKPFMMPLKEKGYLDDPDKFNFLMELAEGNVDALKTHMKTLKVDPFELDLDTVNYSARDHRASDVTIALDETFERAKVAGVDDKLNKVIGGEWDEPSIREFIDDPRVRADLLEHMQNGVYDMVQDKIKENKVLDYNFGTMKSTDQYRHAFNQLVEEYKSTQAKQTEAQRVAAVEAEKKALLEKQREEQYKQSVAEKNKQVDEQRKKVATMNNVKKKPVKTKTSFDPLKLADDDLDALVNGLINGTIK